MQIKNLDIKGTIKKELIKAFSSVPQPSYAIEGSDICWECEQRHTELDNGRAITIDDIASSCYPSIFYKKPNVFTFLIPILLIKVMDKECNRDRIFLEIFLQELRKEEKSIWFNDFSNNQKNSIIKSLQFIHSLYVMEEYEKWDFDKEKMIYYDEEEKLEKETRLTLNFWQNLLKTSW